MLQVHQQYGRGLKLSSETNLTIVIGTIVRYGPNQLLVNTDVGLHGEAAIKSLEMRLTETLNRYL